MTQTQKTVGIYSPESMEKIYDLYSSAYPHLVIEKDEYKKTVFETSHHAETFSCISLSRSIGRSLNIFENPHSFLIGQKNIEIANLKETIAEMKRRLDLLERHQQKVPIQVRVVEIQDKPLKEIYDIVLNYYNTHEVSYPDEVADAFGLDLRKVIEVVTQLIEEGKIEVAA